MQVYIEIVIIDNMLMTALIGWGTMRILRRRCPWWRIALVASIGTLVAVLSPFVRLGPVWWPVARLVLGIVLGAILAGRLRGLGRVVAVFFGLTFAFGGAVFGVNYLLVGDVATALTSPVSDVPLGMVLAVGVGVCWGLRRLGARLHRAWDSQAFLRRAVVSIWGRTFDLQGFVDSGNRLCDPDSGLPIVVLDVTSVPLLAAHQLELLRAGLGDLIAGCHYVPLATASGAGRILVTRGDKLQLYIGQSVNIYDVMIGLAERPLGDFALLLHPSML